ncbi:hypothetical protein [Actinoalloteichus caeruleus]|uniref:hypothetical protein n=1 Tax=Actinoalloteichus cyanogriseus TaxID=2893586 RepID=UPI003AAD7FFB
MPHSLTMEETRPTNVDHMYAATPTVNRDLQRVGPGDQRQPLARHHIIPYNVLRDFWNKLVEEEKIHLTHPLLKVIQSKLVDGVNGYKILMNQDDRTVAAEVCAEVIEGATEFESDRWENFALVYAWLPGNLFLGPDERFRKNPATDEFEEHCSPIVGKQVYSTMRSAYNNMKQYINSPDHPERLAKDAISGFRNSASTLSIYQLNKNKWYREAPLRNDRFRTWVIIEKKPRYARADIDSDLDLEPDDQPGGGGRTDLNPIDEIRISATKGITINRVEHYKDYCRGSGGADDISLADLSAWAEKEFHAQVPPELRSAKVTRLLADVITLPGRTCMQITAAISLQLGGTSVDMFADFICTRTSGGGTQPTTSFGLSVSIAVPVGTGGDNCLWFDGVVQKGANPSRPGVIGG